MIHVGRDKQSFSVGMEGYGIGDCVRQEDLADDLERYDVELDTFEVQARIDADDVKAVIVEAEKERSMTEMRCCVADLVSGPNALALAHSRNCDPVCAIATTRSAVMPKCA